MDILRENIKTLLKLYTQQELANLAGKEDRTALSCFINGKSKSMNIETIRNIAQQLNLSIDDLCNKKIKIKLEFEEEE